MWAWRSSRCHRAATAAASSGRQGQHALGELAERAVEVGLGAQAGRGGDGADRAEPVAVQPGVLDDGGAARGIADHPDLRDRVLDQLLDRGALVETADLQQPQPDGDALRGGRRGGAGLRRREAVDPLQPRAVGPVIIAGLLPRVGRRQGPVLAVIGHQPVAEAGQHVAVGVIGQRLGGAGGVGHRGGRVAGHRAVGIGIGPDLAVGAHPPGRVVAEGCELEYAASRRPPTRDTHKQVTSQGQTTYRSCHSVARRQTSVRPSRSPSLANIQRI